MITIVHAEVLSSPKQQSRIRGSTASTDIKDRVHKDVIQVQAHSVPANRVSGKTTTAGRESRKKRKASKRKSNHGITSVSNGRQSNGIKFLPIIATMTALVVFSCWVSVFLSQNPLNMRRRIVKRSANTSNVPKSMQPKKCSAKPKPTKSKEEIKKDIMDRLHSEGEIKLKMKDGSYSVITATPNTNRSSPQPKSNNNNIDGNRQMGQCKRVS
mmetsp:Transcript_18620/g.53131  ORF Transcript_18620/g.53131 Transcript_18620/m.53131 type:complete len:213 (+) Transcript_18620:463-1101(+)|eukprot:CAMPEP_0119557334 /NCGR_PEP_ID=MMETSP1352-20130426/9037_1 /TAXON_ID=265584 /ORGANISM="Stauroneis constricta, Strain CCMP1120" /LENGTH=212 /DNA_ID=CAMNT_0007604425 /DNA_START=434 /DNA_END=1072 /DNA_ORIENTATION=+